MHYLRILSLILLTTALSACQFFKKAEITAPAFLRLQGTLTHSNGQWLLYPCAADKHYSVLPETALSIEFNRVIADAPNGLFADLGGQLDATQQYFTPSIRYRLQSEGQGCSDQDFPRLLIRASGNEPFWSILQTPAGLIFNQVGQPAIVLPYIEEQMPDGRFHISTQANKQNLQLWITPQQCTDSMSGTVYHLSAQLQWNQQTLYGCATFGALRN